MMPARSHELLHDCERGRVPTPVAMNVMTSSLACASSPALSHNRSEDILRPLSQSPDPNRRKRLSFFARSSSETSRRQSAVSTASITLMSGTSADDPVAVDSVHRLSTLLPAPPSPSSPPPAPFLSSSSSSSSSSSPSSSPSSVTKSAHRPLSSLSRTKTSDQLNTIRRVFFRMRQASPLRAEKTARRSNTPQTRPPSLSFETEPPSDASQPTVARLSRDRGSLGHSVNLEEPRTGQFDSPKEFYHHLKKTTISPPFNFQHVTHTARKHLSKLDTVDEKDAPAESGTADLNRRSKSVRGAEPSEVQMHKAKSFCGTASSRASMAEPTVEDFRSSPSRVGSPSVDETTFDERMETKFDLDEVYQSLGDVGLAAPVSPTENVPPRPWSALHALRTSTCLPNPSDRSDVPSTCRPNPSDRSDVPSICLSNPSDRSDVPSTTGRDDEISPTTMAPPPPLAPSLPAESAPTLKVVSKDAHAAHASSVRLSGRTAAPDERPLLALPPNPSYSAVKKVSNGPGFSVFPASSAPRVGLAPPPRSRPSSNSTTTTEQPASPSNSRTDIWEESTWEDDIDFAYEQEAEGRCDFDWEADCSLTKVANGQASPADSGAECGEGGVRLSVWLEQPSALQLNPAGGIGCSSPEPWSPGVVTPGQRKRGPSVGHKGFVAARKSSGDSKGSISTHLDLVCGPTGLPPPKLSPTGLEMDEKSKQTADLPDLQYPSCDATAEYLSDPESIRSRRWKHRTTSSFGSFLSSGQSLHTASDTARSPAASTSSLPDLVFSRIQSYSSLTNSQLPRPHESVPQSLAEVRPGGVASGEDDCVSAPSRSSDATPAPTDSVIFMRRPETSHDREILRSAGRTVQLGRAATLQLLQARGSTGSSDLQHDGWI